MNRGFLQSHRSHSGGFHVTFSIAVYEFALNWKEIKNKHKLKIKAL